jgi:hypothetical protein
MEKGRLLEPKSPSGRNSHLRGRIKEEAEDVTLVSGRQSPRQFPLHPYTVRCQVMSEVREWRGQSLDVRVGIGCSAQERDQNSGALPPESSIRCLKAFAIRSPSTLLPQRRRGRWSLPWDDRSPACPIGCPGMGMYFMPLKTSLVVSKQAPTEHLNSTVGLSVPSCEVLTSGSVLAKSTEYSSRFNGVSDGVRRSFKNMVVRIQDTSVSRDVDSVTESHRTSASTVPSWFDITVAEKAPQPTKYDSINVTVSSFVGPEGGAAVGAGMGCLTARFGAGVA